MIFCVLKATLFASREFAAVLWKREQALGSAISSNVEEVPKRSVDDAQKQYQELCQDRRLPNVCLVAYQRTDWVEIEGAISAVGRIPSPAVQTSRSNV